MDWVKSESCRKRKARLERQTIQSGADRKDSARGREGRVGPRGDPTVWDNGTDLCRWKKVYAGMDVTESVDYRSDRTPGKRARHCQKTWSGRGAPKAICLGGVVECGYRGPEKVTPSLSVASELLRILRRSPNLEDGGIQDLAGFLMDTPKVRE